MKSPRVWDVICSTLVLYRSTPGLDRGVGVFKGDYTQRQGWLYWRSLPVALIRHHGNTVLHEFFYSSLPTRAIYTRYLHYTRVSNISPFLRTKVCELKIELREKSVDRYAIENQNCWGKLGLVQPETDHPPPVGIDLTRTVHESRRIVNYPRNRIRSADA